MSCYTKPNSPFWQFDFEIKRSRFYGTLEDERGQPILKTVPRKAAEAREAVLKHIERAKMAAGAGPAKSSRMTLDEAIGRYWSEHARHLTSADDLWDYAENWKRIGDWRRDDDGRSTPLFRKHLDQLTNSDVAWYVSQRRGERIRNQNAKMLEDGTIVEPPFVSNRRVNADVEFLRAVFNRARDNWDVDLPRRPVKWGSHLLPEPEERTRRLLPEEAERIKKSIEKIRPDFLDVHQFLGLSGRRETEVFRLEKRYVDRRNMQYGVHEKAIRGIRGKRLRWYPMTPEQLAIIDRNWLHHPTLVFTYVCRRSVHNPAKKIERHKGLRYPFSKNGWRRQWGEILADAGMTGFRVHDWRHDFATQILDKTGNLKMAKELLGHSTIATTSKYAHVGDEAQRRALSLVGHGRVPQKPRTGEG